MIFMIFVLFYSDYFGWEVDKFFFVDMEVWFFFLVC